LQARAPLIKHVNDVTGQVMRVPPKLVMPLVAFDAGVKKFPCHHPPLARGVAAFNATIVDVSVA
jgi:hypothetical protein